MLAVVNNQPLTSQFVIGPRCRERFLPLTEPAGAGLRDIGVAQAGLSELAPPYEMIRPDPFFHLVLATLTGRGWCRIAGCEPTMKSGDLLVVPAGTPCAYGISGSRWHIAWFHIERDRGLGAALGAHGAVIHHTNVKRLVAAMDGFIDEVRAGDNQAATFESRLIAHRLEREVQVDLDRISLSERRRLGELWNLIDRNLRHRWTIGDLASACHVSPATLFRLCARHAGVRPMEQVAKLRMQRAGQLLHNSDEPVKTIARLVGYGDASAFSTAYRRITGRSPAQDRG